MPDIRIRDEIWKDFVLAAGERRRKPETLAEEVLRDFVRQLGDEQLIERSAIEARRSGLKPRDAVRAVRQYRRKKQSP